jgi:putative SOS response-associated peptidase YedK
MCNRFKASYFRHDVVEQFQAWDEIEGTTDRPRFNVAPTQPILIVRVESGKRKISEMRWGLIPSWASSISSANFNARSESVTITPSFKELIRGNRCLIPADAFYEWQKIGNVKQPYAFEVGDGRLFGFAGLWDEWKAADGRVIRSCTILTTEANSLVSDIHDRMPVIVAKENYEVWLNPRSELQAVLAILRPYDPSEMRRYPVDTKLNNSQNEGREVSERVEIETPAQRNLF